jgi:hypothetical protein
MGHLERSVANGWQYDGDVGQGSTVQLPSGARQPFQVYVNGVLQREGIDYAVEGRTLRFSRPLAQEGKLGKVRWASMLLGVAGTYRKHDSVDVVYEVDGRRAVATGLPVSEQDAAR